MIDVIIPAYNAHSTILKTLLSLNMQTFKNNLNIIIVNDHSDFNYKEIIDKFKNKLMIKEYDLSVNKGPGFARQFGLEHSNNEFIIFIDSDDELYNIFSIENLLKYSANNDMAIGGMIEEYDGGNAYFDQHDGCLHGKLYKRSFIEKYKIHFNYTRGSEDHSFNQLYMLANPKIGKYSGPVYVYKNNKSSLTRNDKNSILDNMKLYNYNMNWTVREAEKRGFNEYLISRFIFSAFCYNYYIYNYENIQDENYIINCKDEIYEHFIKYQNKLSIEEKNLILNSFKLNDLKKISFNQFLNLFNN
jgi:glycosyltransferase involved in cell wall biosynthesis